MKLPFWSKIKVFAGKLKLFHPLNVIQRVGINEFIPDIYIYIYKYIYIYIYIEYVYVILRQTPFPNTQALPLRCRSSTGDALGHRWPWPKIMPATRPAQHSHCNSSRHDHGQEGGPWNPEMSKHQGHESTELDSRCFCVTRRVVYSWRQLRQEAGGRDTCASGMQNYVKRSKKVNNWCGRLVMYQEQAWWQVVSLKHFKAYGSWSLWGAWRCSTWRPRRWRLRLRWVMSSARIQLRARRMLRLRWWLEPSWLNLVTTLQKRGLLASHSLCGKTGAGSAGPKWTHKKVRKMNCLR